MGIAVAKLYYKDKQTIGLDLNQTGMKIMSIDRKHWTVEGYGSLDLDPEKVQECYDSADDSYLVNSLKELITQHLVGRLPSDHVVIGLPTDKSYSRTFSIPASEEKHLASAVEVEVNQYIPIPIEALYVSYEIIERSNSEIKVTMCAMPKQIINVALNVARQANLRPVMIEPSINAVARVLQSTEEADLTTLIVDIGQAATDIAVLEKGTVRISGGLNVGGNTFTLDIARELKLSLDSAHQMKVLHGLKPGRHQAKVSSSLEPSLKKISDEIRKITRFYTERVNSSQKIEQVLIVGAGSNVPGIGDYYTNSLYMPVRVAVPWQKLNFGKLTQPNKQFRPRYITVAGLASIDYERLWK